MRIYIRCWLLTLYQVFSTSRTHDYVYSNEINLKMISCLVGLNTIYENSFIYNNIPLYSILYMFFQLSLKVFFNFPVVQNLQRQQLFYKSTKHLAISIIRIRSYVTSRLLFTSICFHVFYCSISTAVYDVNIKHSKCIFKDVFISESFQTF